MNKIKNILGLIVLSVILYSCGDDNSITNPYEDVDHLALAVSENDSIMHFFKTHYYDSTKDSLKLIDAGQPSMFSEKDKMKIIEITENEIAHKLYVYITQVGIPDFKDKNNPIERKSNPTEMDSVFVNRKGIQLLGNTIDYDNNLFDEGNQTWWSLGSTFGLSGQAPSPIKGWSKGFPLFKSGENVTNNGPITYNNTGKGYLFIPSGLAYTSINYQIGDLTNALFDKTLVFEVELLDIVENTDHDNDGAPSIEEDTDGDGDPTNDFTDPDNPTTPDYLNPNIK